MTTRKEPRKPAGSRSETGGRSNAFTEEERTAMKARARERAAEAKANRTRADGEREVTAAIEAMPETDRTLAARLHAIIAAAAPALAPRTWYGMPAYAKDGKVVCFFQSAAKFKTRYATFGFNDAAKLDEGDLWPVAFALKRLTPTVEARIAALVERAVS